MCTLIRCESPQRIRLIINIAHHAQPLLLHNFQLTGVGRKVFLNIKDNRL